VIFSGAKLEAEYFAVVADELNVKEVKSAESLEAKEELVLKENGALKVALNIKLTPELKTEGLLREATRAINNLRREMNLTLADRVQLIYATSSQELKKLFGNQELMEKLKKSTLLSQIQEGEAENEVKINNEVIRLKIVIRNQ